ncbi:hypothetical protein ACLPHM_06000 [Paenalcaligenes sp. Me131]|uniref:hypothetical protein n=1 Tax=Paenalcaligenes sp. Me131 TaxID=3392636 RepID=UPI003D26B9BF
MGKNNDSQYQDSTSSHLRLLVSNGGKSSNIRSTLDAVVTTTQNYSKNSVENQISRPELDAKLETIEARMDGRLARIEDRFASMEKTMEQINQSLEKQRNTPWKAASATIAVMLATIIAVGALAFTAFDSGRETAQVAADAKADIAASAAEVKEMIKSLQQAQQAPAQAAPQPATQQEK